MTRPAYYNEIEAFGCAWLRQAITEGLLPAGDVDERDVRLVQPDELRGYGQLHFFAGIGGGALACRLAGVPDDFPIITAGVPCQPASLAGNRRGAADERWLWPDFLRLLGDRVLRSHYALVENPPGILTLADGGAWADILSALAEMGRDVEWSSVSAADVGASHERERIWIVAYAGCGRVQPLDVARAVGSATAEDGGEGLQRERRTAAASGRGEDGSARLVADADGAGLGEQRRTLAVRTQLAATEHGGEAMADADSERRRTESHGAEFVSGEEGRGTTRAQSRGCSDGSVGVARSPQSAVGRTAHGLPAYLGGAQWVARPGEPQHEWEAPRLVTTLDTNGRKALAAFGNAWVPQAAVPALHTILEHARRLGQ